MARKFIVNKDHIRFGNVQYHKELSQDHSTTKGGGLYQIDTFNHTVLLYGKSEDFGITNIEDVKTAIAAGNIPMALDGYKWYWSQWYDLERAQQDKQFIGQYGTNPT